MKITQTDFIVGALALGFFVYITARGQLPDYLSVFTKAAPVDSGASKSANWGDNISSWFSKTANDAQQSFTSSLTSSFANAVGSSTSGNTDFSNYMN